MQIGFLKNYVLFSFSFGFLNHAIGNFEFVWELLFCLILCFTTYLLVKHLGKLVQNNYNDMDCHIKCGKK